MFKEKSMYSSKYFFKLILIIASLVVASNVLASGLVIQEDDPSYCGGDATVENTHSGYSGNGYINVEDGLEKSISWKVYSENFTFLQVEWRYAYDSWDRLDLVSVNGSGQGTVPFDSTGSLDNWSIGNEYIYLSPGVSEITLSSYSYYAGLPNIDYIHLHSNEVLPVDCSTSN